MWKRLLRVTAYVIRFCHNIRSRSSRDKEKNQVNVGPLNAEEIVCKEEYWIKRAQAGLSAGVAKGSYKSLSPFVDDKGIVRVGGRVDPALVSYDAKHAALLPHDHWVSVLITRNAHQAGHPGIATTTAKVRRKYWVVKGNKISKVVKRQCTFCREIEAKVETQLMAKLPSYRLKPFTPPFLYTSCDYFGPIKVKVGRNKTAKHYEVLFTCLNSRAIHCELATDASTKWQMAEWQFTTPLAPHHNGCSESMVTTTKSALKKVIGDAVLTPFELYTCLLKWQISLTNDQLAESQMIPTMVLIFVQTTSYWAEPQTEFPKVHFATRITHTTELSSAKKLSTHFGRGGGVMFSLTLCQERNGTQKAGM